MPDNLYYLYVDRWVADGPGSARLDIDREEYEHEDMAHYAQQQYEAKGVNAWVETPEDRAVPKEQMPLPEWEPGW